MKILRRLFAVILTVAVALTALSVTVSADSIADTAVSITSGNEYTKILRYNSSSDYADYKIDATGCGKLIVSLNSTNKYIGLRLYDSNFNVVEVNDAEVSVGEIYRGGIEYDYIGYYWNDTGERIVSQTTWNIEKGVYYLRADNSTDSYGYKSSDGKITITATFPQDTTATTSPAATDGSILSTIKSMLVYFTVDIPKGSTLQLGAITPNLSVPISWTSHNTNVATIATNGEVTAKAKGSAYIAIRFGPNVRIVQVNVV